MKISERWLREWVDPPVGSDALAEKLNLAGLECAATPLLDQPLSGIVVGRIIAQTTHPDADRLWLCKVEVAAATPRSIVCGAPNAAVGVNAPVALPGTRLPGGTVVAASEIRGEPSEGMLCSAAELGFAEKADGLLILDTDARPGTPIEEHLRLDDHTLEFDLTPNRGDCLGIAGLAREVSALYGIQCRGPAMRPALVVHMDSRTISVDDPSACPHYVGRVVIGVRENPVTPDWMREYLRRSGIRMIHPLVDITNYVMLELGQPMHAFDNSRLRGTIRVRQANPGERLDLLNETTIELTADDLVIADESGPLALAGIMGGVPSSVGSETRNVFLESACFDPVAVARNGRRHRLLSDARHRFERGVDPALQRKALDRATVLITEICGGEAGPVVEIGRAPAQGRVIQLRHARITRLLGCDIPHADVMTLLGRLGIKLQSASAGTWRAEIPSCRYDLQQEADLVEEVGRLYGYDRIPPRAHPVELPSRTSTVMTPRGIDSARDQLAARGYHEIISYSFVDHRFQSRLNPEAPAPLLDNPIAETMNAMRTSLWTGLLGAWNYNRQRQRPQARLFEIGVCFQLVDGEVVERTRLGGLIAGTLLPEQWGAKQRPVDFYDLKADVEALQGPASIPSLRFAADKHPALHPGRCARVYAADIPGGWLGELHPELCREMGLPSPPLLFELDWAALSTARVPSFTSLSSQPSVRRDLALVVAESLPAQTVAECARNAGVDHLRDVHIFDIYRGPNLPPDHKSVALSLIFQDYCSTLTDGQIDTATKAVADHLIDALGAAARSRRGDSGGTD